MPDQLLLLQPPEDRPAPEAVAVENALADSGFAAGTVTVNGERHLRPGPEFLYQLIFLGCSPVVALGEPGATGDQFCHLDYVAYETPRFIAGENLKPPRCPHCRTRVEPWEGLPREWRDDPESRWECPGCGNSSAVHQLDWRRSAGWGHRFLRIWGIFEGEAVPGDELLKTLAGLTGGREWRYFYFRG